MQDSHTGITRRRRRDGQEQEAYDIASKKKEITDHLKPEILRAQYQQQEYADGKRHPPPIFKVGDKVRLNA